MKLLKIFSAFSLTALFLFIAAFKPLFTLSGSMFVKYAPDGPWFSDNCYTNHFDDLAMGIENSGFQIHFTRLTVTVLMRDMLTNTASVSNCLDALTNADPYLDFVRVSSPGYVRFSRIRIGNMEMATGFLWHTLMTGRRYINSVNEEACFNYHDVYFDCSLNWRLTDSFSLGIRDDDRMVLAFQAGNSRYVSSADTNDASAFGYHVRVPVNAKWNLGWLTSEHSLHFTRDEKTYSINGNPEGFLNTNRNMASSLTSAGWHSRNFLRMMDRFGLYIFAGYDYTRSILVFYGNDQVRYSSGVASAGSLPLYGGIVFDMAPGITWAIGAGYVFRLENGDQLITNGVTNTLTYGSSWSSYGADDRNVPFCSVGLRGRAGNWELGIFYSVRLEISDIDSERTVAAGYFSTKALNPLSFANSVNYDENVYMKWSYEGIEIKGVLAAVPGMNSIMNMLSSVRLAIFF